MNTGGKCCQTQHAVLLSRGFSLVLFREGFYFFSTLYAADIRSSLVLPLLTLFVLCGLTCWRLSYSFSFLNVSLFVRYRRRCMDSDASSGPSFCTRPRRGISSGIFRESNLSMTERQFFPPDNRWWLLHREWEHIGLSVSSNCSTRKCHQDTKTTSVILENGEYRWLECAINQLSLFFTLVSFGVELIQSSAS